MAKGKHSFNPSDSAIATKKPFYVKISNDYATLPEYSADPPSELVPPPLSPAPPETADNKPSEACPSKHRLKQQRRSQRRFLKRVTNVLEHDLLNQAVAWAEDERTDLAKQDTHNPARVAIDRAHAGDVSSSPSLLQHGRNIGQALSATIRCVAKSTFS